MAKKAKTRGGTISWQNKSEKIHRTKLRSLIAGPENNLYPSEQTKTVAYTRVYRYTDLRAAPFCPKRRFIRPQPLRILQGHENMAEKKYTKIKTNTRLKRLENSNRLNSDVDQ